MQAPPGYMVVDDRAGGGLGRGVGMGGAGGFGGLGGLGQDNAQQTTVGDLLFVGALTAVNIYAGSRAKDNVAKWVLYAHGGLGILASAIVSWQLAKGQ